MGKRITIDDLLSAKELHKFTWYWDGDMPSSRYVKVGRGGVREFYLSCGNCHTKKWVKWRLLRSGGSKTCHACNRLPALDKVVDLCSGTHWTPVVPLVFRSTNKRRSILLRCKCGHVRFVLLNRLQSGRSKGCHSCGSGRRTHGFGSTSFRRLWVRLLGRGVLPKEWLEFESFASWATLHYRQGCAFRRIDCKKPYGPKNCAYFARKNGYVASADIVLGAVSDDVLLPVGR